MSWQFDLVAGPYDTPTDGPCWDGDGLLFTNIVPPTEHGSRNRILRYDPRSGEAQEVRRWTYRTVALARSADGELYGCQSASRRIVHLEAHGATTVPTYKLDGEYLNEPNDLVVDSRGRIWFADPVQPGIAGMPPQFASRVPFAAVNLMSGAISEYAPNGLCFSPDESRLYVNNTRPGQIHVWDVQPDGTLTNRQMFDEFGDDSGYPDGMKCDALGNVWCTAPGGVWAIDPDGNRLGAIKVPEHLANFQFGGDDLKTIYLTARTSVYAVKVNVPGLPTPA